MKILDCTLRDGGYYTNWDFDHKLVDYYLHAFNKLPVEYLELGYRSIPLSGYHGQFFYSPIYLLERLRKISNKKLVIILDEKNIRSNHVEQLLKPCVGLIDMVRLAIDPQNFKRALDLAGEVKKLGFEVGFNVMYMSKWTEYKEFISLIKEVNGIADYFYMVDSYGGVYPEDVKNAFNLVKSQCDLKVGFHGHNNLELALINTLTAIECGVEIIDATVTGMGRGAGNLKTELLLTALNVRNDLDIDFNALTGVVDEFSTLQETYGWGTNLAYMVSGSNSLPQKDVMDWVSKRYYSFNSIIRALHNQKAGVNDNQTFKQFKPSASFKKAILIGGGGSAVEHATAIKKFAADQKDDICIIHSSSKNAYPYADLNVPQFYCLVGNEGHRLTAVFDQFESFKGTCILPPFPRTMGTFVPDKVMNYSYELGDVTFTSIVKDSHTALALQTALMMGVSELYVTGYDGYVSANLGIKEQELFIENESLFKDINQAGITLKSLTPTRYKSLQAVSVYSLVI